MDSTLVATFEEPQQAEETRKELLERGIVLDKDVSVVRQRSAVVEKKGPVARLKGLFGVVPPLRERAILTVYADAGTLALVGRVVRQNEPADVRIHLSQSSPDAVGNARK